MDDDARRRCSRVAFAGPLSRAGAGLRRPAAVRLRGARPVGVHEPGDGLRAAAGRRTQARVRVRVGRERGDDGRVHGAAGRVRQPGRARPAARQLRRLGGRRARPVVGAAPARVAARAARRTCARCCASGCRRCPADASVYALQVADRFYLFRVFSQSAAGAVRDRDQARHRRVRGGARLPVRVAAAGVLDRERRGGGAAVLAGDHLLRAGDRRRRLRGGAARALDGAAARRATNTSAPTARCRGWRSGGRCTACTSCSSRSPGARASPRATSPRPRPASRSTSRCWSLLVPHSGAGLGIAGAGIALCGAYVAMLLVMYLLTRSLFKVGFEWLRLAQLTAILAGVAVSGRAAAARPRARGPRAARSRGSRSCPRRCVLTRFFHPHERAQARGARGRRAQARDGVPRRARRRRGIRGGSPEGHLTPWTRAGRRPRSLACVARHALCVLALLGPRPSETDRASRSDSWLKKAAFAADALPCRA